MCSVGIIVFVVLNLHLTSWLSGTMCGSLIWGVIFHCLQVCNVFFFRGSVRNGFIVNFGTLIPCRRVDSFSFQSGWTVCRKLRLRAAYLVFAWCAAHLWLILMTDWTNGFAREHIRCKRRHSLYVQPSWCPNDVHPHVRTAFFNLAVPVLAVTNLPQIKITSLL